MRDTKHRFCTNLLIFINCINFGDVDLVTSDIETVILLFNLFALLYRLLFLFFLFTATLFFFSFRHRIDVDIFTFIHHLNGVDARTS